MPWQRPQGTPTTPAHPPPASPLPRRPLCTRARLRRLRFAPVPPAAARRPAVRTERCLDTPSPATCSLCRQSPPSSAWGLWSTSAPSSLRPTAEPRPSPTPSWCRRPSIDTPPRHMTSTRAWPSTNRTPSSGTGVRSGGWGRCPVTTAAPADTKLRRANSRAWSLRSKVCPSVSLPVFIQVLSSSDGSILIKVSLLHRDISAQVPSSL